MPPLGFDQYVDGTYEGESTGAIDAPWKRIRDAVDHALDGQRIYVDGSASASTQYAENVRLERGISLSGRCRRSVVIVGAPGAPAIALLADPLTGALGSVSGVTVTGGSAGIRIEGGNPRGATTLSEIGIQEVAGPGISVLRADVTIAASYVRGVADTGILIQGAGIPTGPRVVVMASSVEGVQSAVEGSRTRCLSAIPEVTSAAEGGGPEVTVEGSLLADCGDTGIYAAGATVTVRRTVVRGASRLGLLAEDFPLWAQFAPGSGLETVIELFGSVIEDSSDVAISVRNVRSMTIEDTTLRNIAGQPQSVGENACREGGVGLWARADATDDESTGFRYPSTISVSRSSIQASRVAGIQLQGVSASINASIVSDTHTDARHDCPRAFGDGIAVYSNQVESNLTLDATRIENSERAGLVRFGQQGNVRVGGAELECNGLGLVAEADGAEIVLAAPASVVCGCGGNAHLCSVERRDIAASLVGLP